MQVGDRKLSKPSVRSSKEAPSGPDAGPKISDSFQHGLDLSSLDPTIRPQDDFYMYAVGGWKKTHPIPDDKGFVGTFYALRDNSENALHEVLEGLDPNAPAGSEERKLADFYASGMDDKTNNEAGAKPLEPIFTRIQSLTDTADLSRELAALHNQGVDATFDFHPTTDVKNSEQTIGEVSQSGLGLPERDYYFKDDDKSKELRAAYQNHIRRTLQLLGDSPASADAAAASVMALETRLADCSMTSVELRDPSATYNIMDRKQLQELAPNVDWDRYLEDRKQGSLASLNVANPKFFSGLSKLMGELPIEDWKSYLRWHAISAYAGALSQPFKDENFEFAKVLSGVKQPDEPWKKVVRAADRIMGSALGRKYVEKNFPPESKARVQTMLKNIRAALKDDIQSLSWMSPATRAQALNKLDAITEKIGYPEKWDDYSGLKIEKGPYVQNLITAAEWSNAANLAKIGQKVDPTAWLMSPPTVNAYYEPTANEIVFPAGILQPPFFNPNADDAVNYGAIGVVIGHEISHGFDDQGAQFDADGNLRNWWSEEDKAQFDLRSQAIVKQANEFPLREGLHLNGSLVVGESIADLGGVELAYQALQKSFEGKEHPGEVDGLSAEKRFFLSFAQLWANNMRPEVEDMRVRTDPHPVSEFRVNGTLANVPEFAQAFDVKPGDALSRPAELRTVLWETPGAK